MSEKPRRRTDYWDDPRAPAATSRKPSASVVLRNHRGELLLLRRAGSGLWTIPTGAVKKKETVTACAIRECREETGLTVELTGLVGVFSDPRHRIAYPGGEVRVPVNVCFHGQPVSGELATDSESEEAAWVAPEDLDDYYIHPAIRRRISHALNGTVPHVDLTRQTRGRDGMRWGAGSRREMLVSVCAGVGVVFESFMARGARHRTGGWGGKGGAERGGLGVFPDDPMRRGPGSTPLSLAIGTAGSVVVFGGRKEGSGEPGTGAVICRGRGRFRVPQCVSGLVPPDSRSLTE